MVTGIFRKFCCGVTQLVALEVYNNNKNILNFFEVTAILMKDNTTAFTIFSKLVYQSCFVSLTLTTLTI